MLLAYITAGGRPERWSRGQRGLLYTVAVPNPKLCLVKVLNVFYTFPSTFVCFGCDDECIAHHYLPTFKGRTIGYAASPTKISMQAKM